jgi:hypothetical protein
MQNSIFHLIKIKVTSKFFWAAHFKELQVNLQYVGHKRNWYRNLLLTKKGTG